MDRVIPWVRISLTWLLIRNAYLLAVGKQVIILELEARLEAIATIPVIPVWKNDSYSFLLVPCEAWQLGQL
jgi:hypothetical protein